MKYIKEKFYFTFMGKNNLNKITIIVIGGLNTDIVALGAKKLLASGELTYVEKLHIGPGGKSRNIAQMIAALSNRKNVAMIGKTTNDPYGLWRLPLDSLKTSGVNTEYISIDSYEKTKIFPGIALIPVDTKGRNQIYVFPGINDQFSPNDVEAANELFKSVAADNGLLVSTLELPYKTVLYAFKKANSLGIKVLFDPGGIDENQNYQELLSQNIFLIKPNEHEAKILTGITVSDKNSAKKAAEKLLSMGVQNVFITLGGKGGYFFNKDIQEQIPVPKISNGKFKDETGCGDQTMAAFTVALNEGKHIVEAAKIAILAGSLQFYSPGIRPVTRKALAKYLK